MGQYGPIPNRTDDLSRERDANRGGREPVTKGQSIKSKPLPVVDDWHTAAKNIYVGTCNSGMAEFYEASDWAMLHMLVDNLSHLMDVRDETGKLPAMAFSAIMSSFVSLGLTEGDRRRIRIELESKQAPEEAGDATLTVISDYRAKLTKAYKKES